MTTTRPEAVLIFRKWLEESTPLYCEMRFAAFSAGLDLRVVVVSDDSIKAKSDDGKSEIAVVLDRAVAFGFADTRATPKEAVDFESGLIVFFDDPTTTDDFETIGFMVRRADD